MAKKNANRVLAQAMDREQCAYCKRPAAIVLKVTQPPFAARRFCRFHMDKVRH